MTSDEPLTDDEFRQELNILHIESLRQQHENRHTNPIKYEKAKIVSRQLKIWKDELDRVRTR